MGGVVRELGGTHEADVLERRKGGKKRKQRVETGSEFGALDFK
jgi:cleavage and polyadenylation specificity factor subunit 2